MKTFFHEKLTDLRLSIYPPRFSLKRPNIVVIEVDILKPGLFLELRLSKFRLVLDLNHYFLVQTLLVVVYLDVDVPWQNFVGVFRFFILVLGKIIVVFQVAELLVKFELFFVDYLAEL
jgi:hypothetical protein